MRIRTPKKTYTFDYPEAIAFSDTQASIFWSHDEIDVSKDIQDIKVNMTEAESHGVITTLKLFTLYELIAGDEYWGNRVKKWFPRPDIQRMATTFSFFELGVHAPFYNKLNEALGLDTDDFYNSYVNDSTLSKRMEHIDSIVSHPDMLVSLGAFSMVEGAILYSNFAFLKHFQAQGKNKLNNVVAGINFSVRDENIHSEAGAWLYKTVKEEGNYEDSFINNVESTLIEIANSIYEHECRIIDMTFERGPIKGITDHQLKNFVQSRLDICLKNLGIESIFKPTYNPIASWFYKGINSIQFHDFFSRVGNEYNRSWSEDKFIW